MRYTGGHIVGYATNKQNEDTIIATSALAIEIVCHHECLSSSSSRKVKCGRITGNAS